MIDQRLYELFENELKFVREEVQEFGGNFEKVAARLRLSSQSTDLTEDPHVSRLIDSFALLMARLRLKLEDEFPEICQAMLSVLYPHYLAPVPSAAIIQFQTNSISAELAAGVKLPRGTEVETEEKRGLECRYRTCFATHVPPFHVSKSEYLRPPFGFPVEISWSGQAEAAIRIHLEGASEKLDWDKVPKAPIRFYLGESDPCANRLFESICRDGLGVGWYSSKAKTGQFDTKEVIRPVGLDKDQSLLEPDPRIQASYRILWEFFVLKEKFRFIEIDPAKVWTNVAGPNLQLVIFLKRHDPNLQKLMSPNAIQLGCAPAVNLFHHDAEPIQVSANQVEYRVIPSHRNPQGMEVHSIRKVNATRAGGQQKVPFLPFHEPTHRMRTSDRDRYWHASRRQRIEGSERMDRGTEVYLNIVDLHSNPIPEDDWTLHVETLCCNRDIVNDIGPKTKLYYHGGPLTARFLSAPTPTLRPVQRDDWVWKLISHLSLNHLSLASDSKGKLLKEILDLYNFQDRDDIRKAIDSIQKVQYERSTARWVDPSVDPGRGPGICRGLSITIEIDEEPIEGIGIYLFSWVLDHFFSTFATINSFTRLKVLARGTNQVIYQGPARSGSKMLV
ncbi:MAG: type VI secretion system baseplate subunit TssF [Planctomycetota bacterium]|jgi:type VI secretion system protein ImpG